MSSGSSNSTMPTTVVTSSTQGRSQMERALTYPVRLGFYQFCHLNNYRHTECLRHAAAPNGQVPFERYLKEYEDGLLRLIVAAFPGTVEPRRRLRSLAKEGKLAHLGIYPPVQGWMVPRRAVVLNTPAPTLVSAFQVAPTSLNVPAAAFVPASVGSTAVPAISAPANAASVVPDPVVPAPVVPAPVVPASVTVLVPVAPTANLPTPPLSPVRCRRTVPASLVTPWKKAGLCNGCSRCEDLELEPAR